LQWKTLVYFMAIRSILRPFGIIYGRLAHCVFIWYIFSGFGVMHQEKSGNPAPAEVEPTSLIIT
jgi:hypothetical protein